MPALPGPRAAQDADTTEEIARHYHADAPLPALPPTSPAPAPRAAPSAGGIPWVDLSAATAGATNNNSSSISVGNVTVNSQATDAAGIARDMRGALMGEFGNPRDMAIRSNTGMN